jgi:acylphosphatase
MADTPQTRESRRYLVSGIVQGVGYRYFAMRVAQRLGLSGYARNLPDGRVEVYAVAHTSKLAEFRKELERGPQGASVATVAEEAAPLNPEFVKGFSIEH